MNFVCCLRTYVVTHKEMIEKKKRWLRINTKLRIVDTSGGWRVEWWGGLGRWGETHKGFLSFFKNKFYVLMSTPIVGLKLPILRSRVSCSGCLAGSLDRACNFWSQSCEFEAHVGCTDYLKKSCLVLQLRQPGTPSVWFLKQGDAYVDVHHVTIKVSFVGREKIVLHCLG